MPWRRGLVNPLAPGRGPTPACTHNCTVLVLTQKESQRAVVGLMHLMTLYSGLVPEQLPERLFPSRLLYYILLLVAQSHCTHPKVGSGIVGSCLPPGEPRDPGLIRAQFSIAHDFGPESPSVSLSLESTPFGVLFGSSSALHKHVCSYTMHL
jgi:hypothetical protein